MSASPRTGAPRKIPGVSRLLHKARSLHLQLPLDLERLAINRGCDYYERDLGPRIPPLGPVPLSNAELAIALIVPSLHPDARQIGKDWEAAGPLEFARRQNLFPGLCQW